ncbi:tetratricopeptide repeat protein [Krasilnikovia sp. M28-CT-15]|uniref:tetratricopeptide repeat protein n=1 Tax=Krasilnikovia sp. M28-CT-15 TaxID=3373540 RepID=UPI00399C66CA
MATLNDRQPLKGQLRFRGTDRCLAELRALGWHIHDSFPAGLSMIHTGVINDADEAFFRALVGHCRGALRVTYTGADAVDDDDETRAVAADRDWIAQEFTGVSPDHDWKQLRRRCSRYLRCGDSWTVRWLLEEMLRHPVRLPANVAHLTGMTYQMQGLSGQAELFYRVAAGDELTGRAGLDSLAMLYVRHHPVALRSLEHAEQLLTTGPEPAEFDGEDAVLDFALRRNALALVHMRMGDLDQAAADMSAALEILGPGPGNAHARAILMNNLGRLRIAAGRPADEVEAALRTATELDPNLPEYWLDLAFHLARSGAADDAMAAARRADELTNIIAEIPALIGYLLASSAKHTDAAHEYLRAAARATDATDHLLEAARQFSAADDYRLAAAALGRVAPVPDTDERAADLALLRLETTANLDGWSPEQLAERLQVLSARFPESELVASNVAAMSGSTA